MSSSQLQTVSTLKTPSGTAGGEQHELDSGQHCNLQGLILGIASEAPCLQMLPVSSVTPLDWGWRLSKGSQIFV